MALNIVVIGAGSVQFGRAVLADIIQSEILREKETVLKLVDINETSLERMASLAKKMVEYSNSQIKVESTTDRTEALKGANYVVTAVARERMRLWEQDYRIPNAHGCNQILGENGGPGALFHALRSLHLIIPICRDIEKICPDVWFLNFTNPEARVLHAVCHLTSVKAAGICHGVTGGIQFMAKMLGREPSEFEVTSAGMNHLYTFLKVIDKKSGKDITEEVYQKALTYEGSPPLFRRMIELFNAFSYPSDDHIGEYLTFGTEYGGMKWKYGLESKNLGDGSFLGAPWERRLGDIIACAEGKKPVDEGMVRRSHEFVVPIISAIESDSGARFDAVNVLNTDKLIENLPAHGAVEVPATVDAQGLHPEKVGALPEPFAELLRRQYAIHKLLTEAYRTGSKKLLLQALLVDPNMHSISSAEKILDDMLVRQKEFLPEFS